MTIEAMPEKFYITTAIDYANSAPHLGTAYEKIGADVIARYMRLAGADVYFVMGNDEHSQNVRKKAEELGQDPKEYCDKMLFLNECVTNKGFKTDKMVICTSLASKTTLKICYEVICLEKPNTPCIYHSFQCFTYTAGKSNGSIVSSIGTVFVWLGNGYNNSGLVGRSWLIRRLLP